ncbi:MAG: hypothetical protein A2161_09595, partial [Candidatus Schekmanbacteria bacterium RBG_13_48_7]
MKELLLFAVDELKRQGADYGDIRIGFYRKQYLSTRNKVVTTLSDDEDSGMGIRAFKDGAWGFVSSPFLTRDEAAKIVKRALEIARASAATCPQPLKLASLKTYEDTWQVPFKEDPFSVKNNEKVELLLELNAEMLKVPGIAQVVSDMRFSREHKLFANTIGTVTDQLLMRAYVTYMATAVGPEGFESRNYHDIPVNKGYEHVREAPLMANARRVAEEAVAILKAPDCPEGVRDLVLLPNHTCLVIHETIGHATELDRVMGWEADFAGTSFATPEKLKKFRYGSEIFNVIADRTRPHGRATVKYDDEGVLTGSWYIIKDGILNDYSTTLSTANLIGAEESHGCSFADSWYNVPILRMPNVSIEPGPPGSPSLDDLIASTDDGILIDGRGSFSIDHQRINFQFGGDCCREIKNGKPGRILRRTTYQSHNPEFWSSVDAICSPEEWQMHGVVNCGKGQPLQIAQLTHGSAPLRVKKV